MAEALSFTAAEIAFVLREPVKAVRKALDDGPVVSKLIQQTGGAVRAVEWADLLYMFAVRALRDELTPKARQDFYRALKQAPPDHLGEVRFGRLSVAMDDIQAEVEARASELAALADKVEFRNSGEAVFKGTGIEVYRVAALLSGGLSTDDVRRDYPSLTLQQLGDAKAYAETHPKPGRPYPKTSFRAAMRGAGFEALDEVLDDDK